MNKKLRFLLALAMCFSMGVSATACDVLPDSLDNILQWGQDDNTDDGNTDDGNTDDGNTDDGNTDGGNTDDGNTDDGNTDDGNTDDGNTDDGNTDDGNTDDGNTDGGNTDDGQTQVAKATVVTATASELAAFNAQGVTLYNLANFQPIGAQATLETAYTFTANETLEEVQAGEYADWIADYYVSVDADVAAGAIGLAGSYDFWDNGAWIAFYSPIDVAANQKIGLLESVGGTPWTYEDIVRDVGTFRCGAFDLDNACSGVKLTVELRLTNPEDATDIITVCVTEYTFA